MYDNPSVSIISLYSRKNDLILTNILIKGEKRHFASIRNCIMRMYREIQKANSKSGVDKDDFKINVYKFYGVAVYACGSFIMPALNDLIYKHHSDASMYRDDDLGTFMYRNFKITEEIVNTVKDTIERKFNQYITRDFGRGERMDIKHNIIKPLTELSYSFTYTEYNDEKWVPYYGKCDYIPYRERIHITVD